MNPQKPTATPAAKLDAAEAHAERLRQIRSSGSYRIAHTDAEFMGRVELRPVRLQLELLKPELIMQEQNVHSTIVVFGGTRILEQSSSSISNRPPSASRPITPKTRSCSATFALRRTC